MNSIYDYKGFAAYYVDDCEWYVAQDEAELLGGIDWYTGGEISIEPLTEADLRSTPFHVDEDTKISMLERMHQVLDATPKVQMIAAVDW